MERLEAIAHGRVQMVTYRYFTQGRARALGLAGEVENLSDGTVRIVAEGPREKLETLLTHLHKGPFFAHVVRVDATWKGATGEFGSFQIRY